MNIRDPQANFIDPPNRSAAGAERFHLDHRHPNPVARKINVLVQVCVAILCQ